MFENTKRFCDSFLELGLPGFDLMVYKDGKCVLRHTNGYSDLENKVRMNGKERYNIYSCSKIITCTAAMQLWERGLFLLEDKLSDYLPEFEKMQVRTDEGVREAKKSSKKKPSLLWRRTDLPRRRSEPIEQRIRTATGLASDAQRATEDILISAGAVQRAPSSR